MNVTLPDALSEWIEMQARLGGHENVDAFVASVLRDEQERVRHGIDAQLLAGLESGEPIEVDQAFWAERRRKLEGTQKHAKESA